MWCVPTVLVYALRQDEVLVMQRDTGPNVGLWVAPGGKVRPGESPYETAHRELVEQAGLEAEALCLRGVCTLVPLVKQWPWFVFVFVTGRFRGELKADEQGTLAWVGLERYLTALPIPEADAIFAPQVLTRSEGCYLARFVYDADQKLMEWAEH